MTSHRFLLLPPRQPDMDAVGSHMKKLKPKAKLNLDTTTVRALSSKQLSNVVGGYYTQFCSVYTALCGVGTSAALSCDHCG